jgi:osmotically-inducible protein OsmY
VKDKNPKVPPSDAQIRDRIQAQFTTKPRSHPALVNVIVKNGTADLWGFVDSEEEKKAVGVLAEVTKGVTAVNKHLVIYQPAILI